MIRSLNDLYNWNLIYKLCTPRCQQLKSCGLWLILMHSNPWKNDCGQNKAWRKLWRRNLNLGTINPWTVLSAQTWKPCSTMLDDSRGPGKLQVMRSMARKLTRHKACSACKHLLVSKIYWYYLHCFFFPQIQSFSVIYYKPNCISNYHCFSYQRFLRGCFWWMCSKHHQRNCRTLNTHEWGKTPTGNKGSRLVIQSASSNTRKKQ